MSEFDVDDRNDATANDNGDGVKTIDNMTDHLTEMHAIPDKNNWHNN